MQLFAGLFHNSSPFDSLPLYQGTGQNASRPCFLPPVGVSWFQIQGGILHEHHSHACPGHGACGGSAPRHAVHAGAVAVTKECICGQPPAVSGWGDKRIARKRNENLLESPFFPEGRKLPLWELKKRNTILRGPRSFFLFESVVTPAPKRRYTADSKCRGGRSADRECPAR